MGDELHSSQRAIDPLFTRAIVPWALECPNAKDLLDYFATTNRFTHNFGQAASRALLLGLEGQGRRGFLTAAGGNGLVINGGMIDRNGGWMGAGSTRMPATLF